MTLSAQKSGYQEENYPIKREKPFIRILGTLIGGKNVLMASISSSRERKRSNTIREVVKMIVHSMINNNVRLSGDQARAIFHMMNHRLINRYVGKVAALRFAVHCHASYKPCSSYAAFLAINGIEVED